jgi:hypothetical protein
VLTKDNADTFRFANEIAFKWFEVHAEQRLKLLNFFLIISGFCLAGFFGALQAKHTLAASVISGVLAAVSGCFKLLDRRSSQLLKLAEDFLKLSFQSVATVI